MLESSRSESRERVEDQVADLFRLLGGSSRSFSFEDFGTSLIRSLFLTFGFWELAGIPTIFLLSLDSSDFKEGRDIPSDLDLLLASTVDLGG